jgi:hypothetical protein
MLEFYVSTKTKIKKSHYFDCFAYVTLVHINEIVIKS